jgi:hypothetical protein
MVDGRMLWLKRNTLLGVVAVLERHQAAVAGIAVGGGHLRSPAGQGVPALFGKLLEPPGVQLVG